MDLHTAARIRELEAEVATLRERLAELTGAVEAVVKRAPPNFTRSLAEALAKARGGA